MLTAAKETTPVSIGNDIRYTGCFLFSCLPSFAAKRKNPAIQAPHLWLKRPPVQKPLLGDFGGSVYHIKKEFDEEGAVASVTDGIGLNYFGARYYDPEIGLWLSVDAAVQYWNLYGYPSNPVMMVDEDGNFALSAAIVSAVIGAGIGTVQGIINAYNQDGNLWDYVRETMIWSNVHGAIGFATGGVGGGIAANIKSGVSGIGGAIIAGAASGAVGGAMSYTGNYVANYAYSGLDQSYLDAGQYFSGLGKSVAIGGVVGGAMGALTELLPKGEIQLTTKDSKPWSHSAIEGDVAGVEYDLSIGPDDWISAEKTTSTIAGRSGWPTYSGDPSGMSIKVSRVNSFQVMQKSLVLAAKERAGTLSWNIGSKSCVGYAAQALRTAGAPSAGMGVHPYALMTKMMIRQGFLEFLGATTY